MLMIEDIREETDIKIGAFLKLLRNWDRVRITRAGSEVYVGYKDFIRNRIGDESLESIGLTGDENIKNFELKHDIKHKNWKQLGLMEPIMKDTPDYKFSDMQIHTYYAIEI